MKTSGKTVVGRAAWVSATLLASLAHAGSPSVAPADPEVRELATASPEAGALVASAETEARVGHPREAWGLFGRAWSLAPRSPVPSRGICHLALALGIRTVEQQTATRAACTKAMMLGGTPEDIRNHVAAWVGGTVRPSMDDLVEASLAAEGAARIGPGEPWGYRALGDLALRLGDRDLLNVAVSELQRVAPEHEQTRQLAALSTAHASSWVWVGRLAIVLALLLTVAHSIARRWTSRGRRRGIPLAIVTITVLISVGSSPAVAAKIDDAHPEASVPSPAQQLEDPLGFADLLTDLAARAQAATARGDHAAAARYYTALTKAVPDQTYAFAKLCDAFAAAGHRDQALVACHAALTRKGVTAGDTTRFVKVLLAKQGPLTPDEHRQANVAIAALESEPRAQLIATRVRCNVAAHEHDRPALEDCTARLAAAAPNDSRTIAFQSALAIEKQRAAAGAPSGRAARALRWAAGGALTFLLLVGSFATAARVLRRVRRARLASL